ncbi:MAG: HNH endonuclease [Phycisphaerales bacterium]|nr:HNH endonuclease [Phycisphaerales bacterium]
MAHIIGRKYSSARHEPDVGANDTYPNLILLCPTHHTLIDSAERDYPPELLRSWKSDWEGSVAQGAAQVTTRDELMRAVALLLAENETAHSEWGPTSLRAATSPSSDDAAQTWQLRRLSVIIPNNRKIVTTLRNNRSFLTLDEWGLATRFIEHAESFESHCGSPRDAGCYLVFPCEFADMIKKGARSAESRQYAATREY